MIHNMRDFVYNRINIAKNSRKKYLNADVIALNWIKTKTKKLQIWYDMERFNINMELNSPKSHFDRVWVLILSFH